MSDQDDSKSAERKLWEKRPDETSAQYQAFCCYRDLDKPRSRDRAWEEYAAKRGLKGACPSSSFQQWQRENDWVDRVEAYDAHMDKVRMEAAEEKVKEAQIMIRDTSPEAIEKLREIIEEGEDGKNQLNAIQDLLDRAGLKPVEKVEETKEVNVTTEYELNIPNQGDSD